MSWLKNDNKNRNSEQQLDSDEFMDASIGAKKNSKSRTRNDIILPYNLDYNSITRFFVEELDISRHYPILDTLLIVITVIMGILPLMDYEFIKDQISTVSVILYIYLIGMFIYIFIGRNRGGKVDSSTLYSKLKKEQIIFLKDESILDDLIEYLRDSDKNIEKYMISIIGFSVPLYKLYSRLSFIEDNFFLISYILVIVGFAILVIDFHTYSYERLVFLNLLQHIKNNKKVELIDDTSHKNKKVDYSDNDIDEDFDKLWEDA